MMPVGLGAEMRQTSTEPQWPVTLHGMASLVSPIASPNRDNESFGQGDGPLKRYWLLSCSIYLQDQHDH